MALLSVLLIVPLMVVTVPGVLSFLFPTRRSREVRNLIGITESLFEPGSTAERARAEVFKSAAERRYKKSWSSQLTLEKRLRFARWTVFSALPFRALQAAAGLAIFLVVRPHTSILTAVLAFFLGPLCLSAILNFCVERRFRRFDFDYPQFLMSVVGLLKTGMTSVGAIEAAAKGLDAKSLVREEVQLMIERMRLGVPEDRSIGAFGEDIYHPEIELFVQALLLSRRVGGNLANTLERLSQQVRKRQYFRRSATAAVSMQRASIWLILGILTFMELYIYYTYPALVTEAINSEIGWQVWQAAIVLIVVSFIWSRQITKLKI
ncbi:MAG: type II secretion system F family protein [Deltaproteobacteria bacterium]|nr:type II secretion system F family protein [Deltaproteobacteria bacterium]